jgi:Organic solute transporter Ostalpha
MSSAQTARMHARAHTGAEPAWRLTGPCALQFWAVYCLIAMYRATCHELADIHPLRKFVLIKMVVFFTFWQGFLLSILGHFQLIGSRSFSTYQTKALATSIQDAIICCECLPGALMFAVSFPARDYMRPGEMPGTLFDNIVDMFDVRDIGRDVGELVDDRVRRPFLAK